MSLELTALASIGAAIIIALVAVLHRFGEGCNCDSNQGRRPCKCAQQGDER